MIKYFIAYIAIAFMMVAMDRFWLGIIAKPLSKPALGKSSVTREAVPADFLFFAVLAMGLMAFAVVPYGAASDWRKTVLSAALFGALAYAAYDLTNPLKNWAFHVSLRNVVLGSVFSSFSAVAGKVSMDWFVS